MPKVRSTIKWTAPTSALPMWIGAWLSEGVSDGNISSVGGNEYDLIKKACSDIDVAKNLTTLCPDRRKENHATREQVQIWLTEASDAYQNCLHRPVISSGEAKKALGLVAKLSRQLAEQIIANQSVLSRSCALEYLLARQAAENPAGYVHHRAGLRAATRGGALPALDAILNAFADDLDEESTGDTKRLDTFDGGDDAAVRRLVRLLTAIYKGNFGRSSNIHVANMAHALTGIDVTADRVRKMRTLRGKS